jgi:hypothetical protein
MGGTPSPAPELGSRNLSLRAKKANNTLREHKDGLVHWEMDDFSMKNVLWWTES